MKKKKKPTERTPVLHIVYSIDFRGDNDDVLTFVFMGATWQGITNVFAFLCGEHGISKSFSQYEEHAPIHRNGKGYRRIAVELSNPNFNFASLDDMKLLIEARLQAEHPCTVKFYPDYEKFINL